MIAPGGLAANFIHLCGDGLTHQDLVGRLAEMQVRAVFGFLSIFD